MPEGLSATPPVQLPAPGASRPDPSDPAWEAARKLEGAFLSEMLKAAGFGKARANFGGGAGEEQFSSFLRDLHAQEMADRGGIGLAEAIYKAMTNE